MGNNINNLKYSRQGMTGLANGHMLPCGRITCIFKVASFGYLVL
jgi:hypothetical protein